MAPEKNLRLTDEQKRAMRVASRNEIRAGNKLGASVEALQELVKCGYLERVGTVNHVPYYQLTIAGRHVLRNLKD